MIKCYKHKSHPAREAIYILHIPPISQRLSSLSYSKGLLQLHQSIGILQNPQSCFSWTTQPGNGGHDGHDGHGMALGSPGLQKPTPFSEPATGAPIWKPSGSVAPAKHEIHKTQRVQGTARNCKAPMYCQSITIYEAPKLRHQWNLLCSAHGFTTAVHLNISDISQHTQRQRWQRRQLRQLSQWPGYTATR